MDYRGQQFCDNIYYLITILFGVTSWIAGYIAGDFSVTFYGWLVGLGISLVLCIPDWPMYNRYPVTWLEEIGHPNGAAPVVTKKAPKIRIRSNK